MDVNELNVALDQRLAGIIAEAGKGLALVVSKWDSVEGKDAYTRDALAPRIARNFDFVPWAPLIFTSSVTGQNVTKLFDLALDIETRRDQTTKTRVLNDLLQKAVQKHPPAGLKNTHPKLRYVVQTDTMPPWFVIHGSNLKFVHWSYKRYLERLIRETYNYAGVPIKFSFIDEKQVKSNKERIKQGKAPVTKAYKKAKEAEKLEQRK
jgi:GTP-binding protein